MEANVNSQEENQNNPNSNNEVENLMLKGHPLHISARNGDALASICGRVEKMKNCDWFSLCKKTQRMPGGMPTVDSRALLT